MPSTGRDAADTLESSTETKGIAYYRGPMKVQCSVFRLQEEAREEKNSGH